MRAATLPCRPVLLAASAVAVAAPSRTRAQASPAGSARVALDATSLRPDGGEYHYYTAGAAVLPFIGEHAQIGVTPSYSWTKGRYSPSAYQTYGAALTANYVFGGGARWRGYAGGFASTTGVVHGTSSQLVGAQAGALYFFDPALAARVELRYRAPTSGPVAGRGTEVLQLALDPYVLGSASAGRVGWAALGAADVSGSFYFEAGPYLRETGAAGTVAPYLARWAQVGVEGQAVQGQYGGAYQARRVRGFGRFYLPLTRRTQPFAEGFVEASTYAAAYSGVTRYGGTLGVRRFLNARVALDAGVRRRLGFPVTLGPARDPYSFRLPGQTGLVVGLATRVGRIR